MKFKYLLRGMGIGFLLSTILFFFLQGKNASQMTDEEIKKRAMELGMMSSEQFTEKNLDKMKSDLLKPPASQSGDVSKEENFNEVKEEGHSPSSDEGRKKEGGNRREGNEENPGAIRKGASEDYYKAGETKQSEASPKGAGEPAENHGSTETSPDSSEGEEEPKKTAEEPSEVEETKPSEAGTHSSQTEDGRQSPQTEESDNQLREIKVEKPRTPAKTFIYKVIPGSSAVRLCKDLEALGLIKDASDFNHFLAVNHYATRIRNGTFTFYENEDYKSIAEKLVSRQMNP